MVININPSRVNISSGGTGKASDRKRQQDADAGLYTAPKRTEVNLIPAPESLMTLIGNAVSALKRGVYWDRGTILNLLV